MQRRDAEGVGGRVPDEPVGGPGPVPVRPLPGTSVVRADDLLDLRFEFRNLGLRRTGRPALVRVDPDAEAFVIVWFPPQSVGEETLLDLEGSFPVPAALSGPSRLAFRIPAQVTAIPFDLDESDLHPRLIRIALDYAAEHADEIRGRIDRNRAMAERSSSASRSREALLA